MITQTRPFTGEGCSCLMISEVGEYGRGSPKAVPYATLKGILSYLHISHVSLRAHWTSSGRSKSNMSQHKQIGMIGQQEKQQQHRK